MHEHLYSEKPSWVVDSKLDPMFSRERSGKGERKVDLAKCPLNVGLFFLYSLIEFAHTFVK